MTLRPPPLLRSGWFWALVAVLLVEFWLFDQVGAKRHTSVYPRWNDQIQYLADGYTAYEHARSAGFGPALWQTFVNPSAQGTLHDVAALLTFTIAGPSRSAALALNVLALGAWQLALFLAVRRATGHSGLAFAAAFLPLALAGPWANAPGSAYDFRLDHLALCALGVTSAAAVLAEGFRSRSGALLFGVATALTLLTRFLTGTYFVLIYAGLFAWLSLQSDRRTRWLNLTWAAALAFILAAPLFWINRAHVLEYYWIGHYVGPESVIRNQNFGLGRSLAFILDSVGARHLGIVFALTVGLGAAAFAFGRGLPDRRSARSLGATGAILLLAPLVVLTLHQQKSEVVTSALVPGVVLLVIALWSALAQGPRRPAASLAAAGVALVAAVGFTVAQLRPAYDAAMLAHIRQVNTLADRLFARVQSAQLRPIHVSVDHITDSLDAQVLRVLVYERHRVWLPFDMALPTGIAAPTEPDVMARLERSHFVFLTEEAPAGGFPYDLTLAQLRPQLQAWCREHLVLAERFDLLGRRMTLYQRREIPLGPDSR